MSVIFKMKMKMKIGRCTYTTKIANSNLQSHSGGAFPGTGQVVRQPCHNARESGINGTNGDEYARINHLGIA